MTHPPQRPGRRSGPPSLPAASGLTALTALTALAVLVALGSMAALPAPAVAQRSADFLFGKPDVSLGVHFGYAAARADSEIFDFVRDELTIGERDFDAGYFGAELAWLATDRFDLGLGVGVTHSDTRSEFRHWVGTDDLPIEQDTRFTRVPVTLGAKAYLASRGREVSRLAWIPAKIAPWVGAGAGLMWYRFEQEGEFVDFDTNDIFFDRFVSEGTTPTFHVKGGADLSLNPRLLLTGEGRYSWASADMNDGANRDFVGFDEIDLAGFQASVGISVRF